MKEDNIKFKFENLQPINFLKRFNKMVDDDMKYSSKEYKKELKVFPLSKFPLPQFYQKMQGIFQTGTKKNDISSSNKKNKEDIQDESFMKKHRQFMTKHLNKLIEQNQQHQQDLQKYKKQYDNNRKTGLIKIRSQTKLEKPQKSKITSIGTDRNYSQRKQHNEGSYSKRISLQNQIQPEQNVINYTYLQKVMKQRSQSFKNLKKEKINIRNKEQMRNYFENRKNTASNIRSKPSLIDYQIEGVQYNNMNPQDRKKKFIKDLMSLEEEQNRYQRAYDKKIEEDIKKFSRTIDSSIQKVKSQKFW